MIVTLDEIFERVRRGQTPRQVASDLGITMCAIRNRMREAGRWDEFQAVAAMTTADLVAAVDVGALMAKASEGVSLNRACVELGYTRAVAEEALESVDRTAEYHVRRQAARMGIPVPSLDAMSYHKGPRAAITAVIPLLDDERRASVMEALTAIDGMIRDGATLSRICGGSP